MGQHPLQPKRTPRDVCYWDLFAKTCVNRDTSHVSFNSQKARTISHYLLRYSVENLKILEIGLGRALIAGTLKNLCWQFNYVGTDLSHRFCDWGKKAFGLTTLQARIDRLPFRDGLFDHILLFDVLEHVDPAIRKVAYREIGRVLKLREAYVFINNPCGGHSGHRSFDWGFTQTDIGLMADALGALIKDLHLYESSPGALSQFVVLAR